MPAFVRQLADFGEASDYQLNMIKNNSQGKFIVIEGLDGSGQTTQVKLLKEYLEGKGFDVVVTKEPTQPIQGSYFSSVAQDIRDVLDKVKTIEAKTFQEMFAQDRKEHLDNQIIPALEQGKWVVCDRYAFSSFAYGTAHGNDMDFLMSLNQNFLMPDYVFLLKVSPQTCMQRVVRRNEGIKFFEVEEKLANTWKQYEDVTKRFPEIEIIDGEKSIKDVHKEIISKIK